ncbi:MAG: NAD(P)-binding protein, partial [Geminicoccaceae bacterium]
VSLDMGHPKQARAMTKADIRAFRQWHRAAARRAKEAGFDIIYVYAGHRMTLTQHFLLPELNQRADEYGGSLENRARLLRELLEETREEVGDDCAVALRFAVDEMKGADGMQAEEEGRAVVEMLADLPDLWDVNVSDWPNDSITTRFQPDDGYQAGYVEFVKQVTKKPVVGVGRLSSPDLMVSLIKRGVLDFIGAARPSIADPFLPNKIEENRIDQIRECIGCNICISADNLGVPIRCTQNPAMGEEWRRGWHPERIEPAGSEEAALVVGAGPAGLECALQLARRGYHVTLAEASEALGGRALAESRLKGLSAWRRVVDNRIYELQQRANVDLYTGSALDAEQVMALGITNVFVATGARWRRDGVGRSSRTPLSPHPSIEVFSPDDIAAGRLPAEGPIVIYDDDQVYLAGVIAEHLGDGHGDITFVTPASVVSPWTVHTLEQERVQRALLEIDVDIRPNRTLTAIGDGIVETACIYSGQKQDIACASLILVTERIRETTLFDELRHLQETAGEALPLNTLELIGDAATPGLIADAVYAGHMAARHFEADPAEIERALFRREIPTLEPS